MSSSRLPGPACTVLQDWLSIDPGTNCRSASPAPGGVKGHPVVTAAEIADAKARYLTHAYEVSYAMQAKSLVPGDKSSLLGGSFLRMYLDHRLDENIVEQAGQEIAASKMFHQLQQDVNEHLQKSCDRLGRPLTSQEISTVADQYLKARKQSKGIAFRGSLNPVVGGVGGVAVAPDAVVGKDIPQATGLLVDYEISVTFSDTYNFENARSGEYDHYRKRLADLLLRNEFEKFDRAYRTEVQPVASWHKTHLDNAALFASFMYAVEKRGWTPGGLPWKVAVPMRGRLMLRSPAKPAHPLAPRHGEQHKNPGQPRRR